MSDRYKELLSMMSSQGGEKVIFTRDDLTCEVRLMNKTPSKWKLSVIEAGVSFYYKDGDIFNDGPHKMNLGSGGSYSFYSDDSGNCVHEIFIALTVATPYEPDDKLIVETVTANPNECLLYVPLTLEEKKSIAESELLRTPITSSLVISSK